MSYKDLEKRCAYQKRWREANPEYHQARYEADKKKVKERVKVNRYKQKYGITISQWNDMFVKQGECCAVCGTNDWGPQGPNTEHCHTTKKVRGIVCRECNLAIGNIKDNPETALRIHQYLLETLI